MKLAVVGKGGAGKTTVAAGLARALAARGTRVLAVDLDTNPGLAVSLGIPLDAGRLGQDAVEQSSTAAYGYGLRSGLTPEAAADRFSWPAAGGISFLQVGNIGAPDHDLGRYLTAVLSIARGFSRPGWHVVADLEAGPTTPYEGYARFADLVLVVCEPFGVSLRAAARLAAILRADGTPVLVAGNRIRTRADRLLVREASARLGCAEPLLVPFDRALQAAARRDGAMPLRGGAMLALRRAAAMLAPMAVPA